MNNEFTKGFEKTAGITSMAKIVKVVRRFKNHNPLTRFPKHIPHPATVNLAKSFRGKERAMEKLQKKWGKERFEKVVKMKNAKDIANYKFKTPSRTIKPSGRYQGTTHDYDKYRKEFKAKAMADKGRKF